MNLITTTKWGRFLFLLILLFSLDLHAASSDKSSHFTLGIAGEYGKSYVPSTSGQSSQTVHGIGFYSEGRLLIPTKKTKTFTLEPFVFYSQINSSSGGAKNILYSFGAGLSVGFNFFFFGVHSGYSQSDSSSSGASYSVGFLMYGAHAGLRFALPGTAATFISLGTKYSIGEPVLTLQNGSSQTMFFNNFNGFLGFNFCLSDFL